MLDWFSGYVGYDASGLELGRFLEVDQHGEVVREIERWETARGSHESGIQINRAVATPAMLKSARDLGFLCAPSVFRFSGNPSKFLQGHNVAGPSVSMLGPVLQAMVRAFPKELRPVDADSEILPACQRSRLDVNVTVDLEAHRFVHDWLQLAATSTRSRHGRALNSSGTVYWGKSSRRWTIKAYCKHCELKKHRPEIDENLYKFLVDYTLGQLRIELTLRRPELEVRGTLSESVVWEFWKRITVGVMKRETEIERREVPGRVLPALALWEAGRDVSTVYSRATFYRYRRIILDLLGVDIANAPQQPVEEILPDWFDADVLKQKEVTRWPDELQRSLFGI